MRPCPLGTSSPEGSKLQNHITPSTAGNLASRIFADLANRGTIGPGGMGPNHLSSDVVMDN
jgi:hypothetical protein